MSTKKRGMGKKHNADGRKAKKTKRLESEGSASTASFAAMAEGAIETSDGSWGSLG